MADPKAGGSSTGAGGHPEASGNLVGDRQWFRPLPRSSFAKSSMSRVVAAQANGLGTGSSFNRETKAPLGSWLGSGAMISRYCRFPSDRSAL